jgi:hypothetical protein
MPLLDFMLDNPEISIPVALVLLRLVLQAVARLAAGRFPLVSDLAARGADASGAAGPVLREIVEAFRGKGPVAQSLPPPPPPSTKRPPPIVTLSVLVLWVFACSGAADFERLAHGARDVADVAEALAVEARDRELAACLGDERCRTEVVEKYRPVGRILEDFRVTWCAVDPRSEGCSP